MIRFHSQHQKRLERVLLTFFGGCILFVVGVYLFTPSILTQGLPSSWIATGRPVLSATLVLGAIVLVIMLAIIGVLCHWRWLFWLLLIAFGFSVLEIPATLLTWTGILPPFLGPLPLWYSVCRMAVAVIEEGLAVWMLLIYRRAGVWGEVELKQSRGSTHDSAETRTTGAN